MKRNRKRTSRFWLIYAIASAALVIAVMSGLVLFYDFIDAFEESQPQSPAEAAKKYASEISESELFSLLNTTADSLEWRSEEARNETLNGYIEAWRAGGMFCKRSGGSEEEPVYTVISGRREIFSLTLSKTSIGRYGFDAWQVTDRSVSFDGFSIYTVTLPEGSVLELNGKVLDDSYIIERDIPYSANPIEASHTDLPCAVTYETELLNAQPTLKARYKEHDLEFSYTDGAYTAKYPASLLYSATVKVPSGASVTVRGTDISSHYEKMTESAFGGLIAEGLTVPSFDVYTIHGLYAPIDNVNVSLNGTALQFEESTDGMAQSITVDIGGVSDDTVAKFADDFTRAYFHYTSSGYRNTAENLAAALSYVLNGSELYTRIRDSKVGYDFVTPVTSQVYNRLEVVRMYRLEDSSYVVKLAFDVDHQIYSESRSYKGDISLHIVNVGTYKIANMVIENE